MPDDPPPPAARRFRVRAERRPAIATLYGEDFATAELAYARWHRAGDYYRPAEGGQERILFPDEIEEARHA
ncbi:hypothetical protein [Rubrimonas cliftonensis]|uniref:Uncharacterized protein n=1 Tax=Rubrimonas cliftonensis TaxID=89524 RepID=A0A1H4ET45_9RHOB|nr:hypothetical protein [Rubrimonas cliftonensis]SEA87422.1 hypothetical protein SAMN05444370_11549 [Rubrimonas cliftonensis]